MSHDRGCYCGREKYEYNDCTRDGCYNREPKTVKNATVKKVSRKSYEISGYVVIPPLSPWEEKDRDKIIPEMSYRTFSTTGSGAWSIHTTTEIADFDFSKRVSQWFDLGYRLKKAKMIIEDE
jgi:hypothetical protein